MADRFPRRLGILFSSLLLLGGARHAAAQSVTVPTFVVRMAYPQVAREVELAQGADGAVLFLWEEVHTGLGYSFAHARRAPSGAELPIAALPPFCCSTRELFPRVGAYAAGGYARMVFGGYFGDFTAFGSQSDALDELLPDSIYQVDLGVAATHIDEGRGGAVATYGDAAFYLLWDDVSGNIIGRRLNGYPVLSGPSLIAGLSDSRPYVAAAELPGRGVVGGWGAPSGTLPHALGAVAPGLYETFGATLTLSTDTVLRRVVASPQGDRFALVGTRPADTETPTEIWGRYFDVAGAPLGPDFPIVTGGGVVSPDAAFDLAGNLYVVWTEGGTALRAVGVTSDGTPSGPPVTLATGVGLGDVRTVRLADPDLANTGRFMNTWTASGGSVVDANVASACTPGAATCGDGVRVPLCEFCDDGAANSDTAPDACRTDCRPARCGDGAVDTGESCDDGNRNDCDGCSATCEVEAALGCGNGLAMPACGEICDDGNTEDGDGCSATCQNELIPGGGSALDDCTIAWSVVNPNNRPRFTQKGMLSASQTCTDNDPTCDFDGGVVGSCTFKVRVCAANSTLPPCVAPPRLASWRLEKPSAKDAAKHPDAAQVVAALNGAVPGAIVGPAGPDVCSPDAFVVVPLRGEPGRFHAAKRALRTAATLYDGGKDTDKLALRCAPM